MSLFDHLRDRRITALARRLLDDFLPPVVREWRPLNRFLATRFHGAAFDLDFKERAFAMTPAQIAAAYAALESGDARYRDTDTTPAQREAIAAAALGRVLEIGCGNGAIAARLMSDGHDVLATDVTLASARATRERARCTVGLARLPELPFRDRAFDTVVCAHTLEHVPDGGPPRASCGASRSAWSWSCRASATTATPSTITCTSFRAPRRSSTCSAAARASSTATGS